MSSLYIIPDGGLGNRLRAMASGIYLSRKLGRSPVVVWHRDALCNAALDSLIDTRRLPARVIRPGEAEYRLFYEAPRMRNLHLPRLLAPMRFKGRYYDVVNLNAYLDDCDALFREVQDIGGDLLFFSGQEFYDFPRPFFRENFTVSGTVARRAMEITAGQRMPEFSIQIRRTDHTHSIANSPTRAFISIVDNHPSSIFFLATDDEDVKQEIIAHAPGRIIANSSPARRDTPGGIVDAMAELLIMSRTKRIYGSYHSSFPEIASWLGDVPIVTVRGTR